MDLVGFVYYLITPFQDSVKFSCSGLFPDKRGIAKSNVAARSRRKSPQSRAIQIRQETSDFRSSVDCQNLFCEASGIEGGYGKAAQEFNPTLINRV